MDAHGQGRKELGRELFAAVWSPDGRRVVGENGVDGLDMIVLPAGRSDFIADDGAGTPTAFAPAWSSRNQVAYLEDQFLAIYTFGARPATQSLGIESQGDLDWSPDGRLIVFSDNPGGSSDLYLMRGDGTGVRRLTWSAHDETDPAWSPSAR